MAVSWDEFNAARGFFFDLDWVYRNANGEVTVIAATIRGINGSKTNMYRRNREVDYRLFADVNSLRSGLPEGWITSPDASLIEHVNIWPPTMMCPLTNDRKPRICWGTGPSTWSRTPEASRTLSNFLEVARQVLNGANLMSPAR